MQYLIHFDFLYSVRVWIMNSKILVRRLINIPFCNVAFVASVDQNFSRISKFLLKTLKLIFSMFHSEYYFICSLLVFLLNQALRYFGSNPTVAFGFSIILRKEKNIYLSIWNSNLQRVTFATVDVLFFRLKDFGKRKSNLPNTCLGTLLNINVYGKTFT